MIVIGGGLAGLSAACALAAEGLDVIVFERSRSLGGRASSFWPSGAPRPIDTGQHIAMGCCTNLMDFCAHIGVAAHWKFHRDIPFLDRAGRLSMLRGSSLPAPLHTAPSFSRLRFLGAADKLAVARAFATMLRARLAPSLAGGVPPAMQAGAPSSGGGVSGSPSRSGRENGPAGEGDPPFSHWLAAHGQTPRAVEAFWRPVVVSALNEHPERVSTRSALLLFRDGFLRHRQAYEIGVPSVPLGTLYGPPVIDYLEQRDGRVRMATPVRQIRTAAGRVSGVLLSDGTSLRAEFVLSAVAFGEVAAVLPFGLAARAGLGRSLVGGPRRVRPAGLPDGLPEPPPSCGSEDADHVKACVAACVHGAASLEGGPIVGIHFCFDRPVMDQDLVALVDRPIHWAFRKAGCVEGGGCIEVVISAAHEWVAERRETILAMAVEELREAFPRVRQATRLHARVTKQAVATFVPAPGHEAFRPPQQTPLPGLFLAGDWTHTGWPATMEGAVRSGYLAAEGILAAVGRPRRLLVPDLPVSWLAGALGRW